MPIGFLRARLRGVASSDCFAIISFGHLIRLVLRSVPALRSCVCVELVKTAHGIIHLLPAPSHHLIRSAPLPVPRQGWRGVFSCLPFGGLCGSVVPARLSVCGVLPFRLSHRYRSRVGSLCQSSVVLGPPPGHRACPVSSSCRNRLVLSSHRLSLRSPDTAGGERGGSRACGMGDGFSCPHGVVSSRLVLAVGRRAACFAAVVFLYRLRLVPRAVLRAVLLLASLLFVIRPVFRQAERGGVLRRSSSCWLVACAVVCRLVGCGVVSVWRVIISGCSRRAGAFMFTVWLGGLLAVPMVYWYYQLVVYIVRLDF